jgi:DNA/RNA-binding domain of Phe-tRNA-synthetase-like protein
MKSVTIDPEIAVKYGGVKIAYLFIDGVKIVKTPPREKKIARNLESEIREHFRSVKLESDGNLRDWMCLAEKMGVIEEHLLPAQIGLIKSILAGRDIPKINNVVDAGNIIAAKYRCPVGIFDAAGIVSNICLRIAKKDEEYLPMFSSHNVKVLSQEIVYSDQLGIFSRYSKDADRTKITDHTNSIFCVIDGTDSIALSHIIEARDELASLIKEIAGEIEPIVSNFVIAKENK